MKDNEISITPGMLEEAETELARRCMSYARECGAQKVRITLNKSLLDLVGMLDGEVDKVTHALDRSLQVALFVDGRFGSFSSNRLEESELRPFIRQAVDTVRMLEPDAARDLPAPERVARDAVTGREMGLFDPVYATLTAGRRREMAVRTSLWHRRTALGQGFTLVSEEGEYSDSVFDTVVMDSQGLFARHTETSFEIGYEVTVEDPEGNRYASYWWDAAPTLAGVSLDDCSETAVRRAALQIGPQDIPGGKYNLVVESECASKLLNPVLTALGGYAIQQKNSFLDGKAGQQVFAENLTVLDLPRTAGETGCRLFDSEGVATAEFPVIDKGVVTRYFINTYIAGKTGLAPTVEDSTRIKVLPTGGCKGLDDVLRKVGSGILVTGFNGGNSNSSTGDFSYGIEGFAFTDGAITHPVREMVVTGNFIDLWRHLLIAADDARLCMSKLIPTLAFADVDCSA